MDDLPLGKGCGLCCIGFVPEGFQFVLKTHTCIQYDPESRTCKIYATRPEVCRNFACGGPDCEDIRQFYHEHGMPAAEFLYNGITIKTTGEIT
jgi:Fe-S-cluster containining protein